MLIVGAVLLTGGAIGIAWQAWQRGHRPLLVAALVFAFLATWLWCRAEGVEVGIPLAIETASLVALAFIVTRIDLRPHRAGRERHVAPPRISRHRRLRGALRTLIAGPLGLAASMAIAVAFALKAPMIEQTRLILAGLIVPSLWALCIIWTVATQRLARAACGLAVASAAGFALALIPRG